MFFGHLAEFWNSITGYIATTTASTIEYGVNFFQNVGSAVAGAIGSVFILLAHPVIDFLLALYYLFTQIGHIVVSGITAPVVYIYYFASGIWSSLTYTAITARYDAIVAGGQFTTFLDSMSGINAYLNAIPAFGILEQAVSFIFPALIALWLFKTITQ